MAAVAVMMNDRPSISVRFVGSDSSSGFLVLFLSPIRWLCYLCLCQPVLVTTLSHPFSPTPSPQAQGAY